MGNKRSPLPNPSTNKIILTFHLLFPCKKSLWCIVSKVIEIIRKEREAEDGCGSELGSLYVLTGEKEEEEKKEARGREKNRVTMLCPKPCFKVKK